MNSTSTAICPLCQQSFPVAELYAHIVRADDDLRRLAVRVIRSNYPNWIESDGACERCWTHSVMLGRLEGTEEEIAPPIAA